MADPFNELLDLVLKIFELNFSEFIGDRHVSEIEVENMEFRIDGIYKKKDSIISRIKIFPVNEIPPDTGVILAMVFRLCQDIWTIPGYDRYSDILTTININKGMVEWQARDITKGTNRLYNIKMDVQDLCWNYGLAHDILVIDLNADQYNMLRQRQDEAIAKANMVKLRVNAFLESNTRLDIQRNRETGLDPVVEPDEGFNGRLYNDKIPTKDIHRAITDFFGGGKRKIKGKSKKIRNKKTNKKTKSRLRKRRL